MPWLRSATEPDAQRRDLARRLHRLQQLFPVERICGETLAAAQIRAYYAECHPAYRKHHSREGAVHMALNDDGRFHPEGFAGQMRRLQAQWGDRPPARVLELGFGQGYNLAWLAERHAALHFEGIDLSPEHLQLAQQRLAGQPRVSLSLADLHRLPQADASVDEVFAVEAFCYASALPQALAEVRRVLRPGGRFQIFDAYITRPLAAMDAGDALAVDLVGRGMALERWQVLGELLAAAHVVGFAERAVVPLDTEVQPSLRRLERICGAIIRVPWLARRALARRAPERSRNVLAGYLLHRTVAMGLLCYRHIVLTKPA